MSRRLGFRMASTDTRLPSSPLKQFAIYNISSSPTFPSPNDVFKRNPLVMSTGGRILPIPPCDVAPFTTTATPLKKRSFDDLCSPDNSSPYNRKSDYFNGSQLAKPKPIPSSVSAEPITETAVKAQRKTASGKAEGNDDAPKAKKVPKPRAKKAEECEEGTAPVKKTTVRKPRAKKAEKEKDENGTGKEKPVRKPRTKKAEGDTQTKMPKGRVKKASVNTISDKSVGSSKSKSAELAQAKSPGPLVDTLDNGLVMAVNRRTDWTPPSNPGKTLLINQDPSSTELGDGLSASIVQGSEDNGIQNLFNSFRCAQGGARTIETKMMEGEVTRKRKLIELVQTAVSSTTAAAITPKPKAPKKKPRTITDQATSAYAVKGTEGLTDSPVPLLQCFPHQTNGSGTANIFKVPRKPRSQLSSKKTSKAKKGTAAAPILLSPESALKQVGHQDFVFGTSSQLAREDSPTLLRDLHNAMQASNQADYDPFADMVDEPATSASLNPGGRPVASTKRTLWSAGARDVTGKLLDVEVIDMVDSPMAMKLDDKTARPNSTGPLAGSEDIWHDIDDIVASLPKDSEPRDLSPEHSSTGVAATIPIASNASKSALSNSQSIQRTDIPKPTDAPPEAHQISSTTAKHQNIQIPDFHSYTNLQLAKELALYHFKPVKNREQMVELLEKCWESKTRIALGPLGPNATFMPSTKLAKTIPPPSSQVMRESPKRPRSKPRRMSAGTLAASPVQSETKGKRARPKAIEEPKALKVDSDVPFSRPRTPKTSRSVASRVIDEIYDSDPPTPSPTRRRPSKIGSPLPLNLSRTVDSDAAVLLPESSQTVFPYITRAIKNESRSKDVRKPSWYEKILLFDPIVLEDLSLWLNTGALEKEGWDGEVTPKEVKTWCASKSICCLWKENLRGMARSRI